VKAVINNVGRVRDNGEENEVHRHESLARLFRPPSDPAATMRWDLLPPPKQRPFSKVNQTKGQI
jgi:hypothetical protein